MNKLTLRLATIGGAAVVMMGISAAPVKASVFADWSQTTPGTPFQFLNAGGGSSLTLSANPIDVNFQYLVPNSYGAVGQPIAAQLTFSSLATSPAQTTLGGAALVQPLNDVEETFTANGKDLLTVTADKATLWGFTGGKTAGLSSDTGLGSKISYTSDFLSLSGKSDSQISTSFISSKSLGLSGDHLGSNTFAGTGSFSAAPVPEVSTMVSFAAIMVFMAALGLRRTARYGTKLS
jgi:hypothetical protein